MNDFQRLAKEIDNLANKVESLAIAQGATLQQLRDMEKQRTEDRQVAKDRCDNHGGRLTALEKGQVKVGVLSGIIGTIGGWLAAKHGG